MLLHKLQSEFLQGVYTEDPQHSILENISEPGELSASAHFEIYRASIFGGLLKSLTEIYPVCKALVGDRFFDAMALTHIRRSPSRQHDLNLYGEDFPVFVLVYPPVSGLPYLSDMAQLEWAWHRAYWAADHERLTPDLIANIQEERHGELVFRLPPSATLLESDYPLLHIRHLALDETEDEILDLDQESEVKLIIWREELELRMASLTDDEWRLLCVLRQGRPFGEVCGHFDKNPTKVPLDKLLLKVFHQGWLAVP